MRAHLQRVKHCEIRSNGRSLGRIGAGLLVLLGVGSEDRPEDAGWLARRIIDLRIFDDERGKMNRSVRDAGGEIAVVSQFTLYGDCRKGRRPSYSRAAPPDKARELYSQFLDRLREEGLEPVCGEFQARMEIELVNDGPVTLLIDTEKVCG